MFLVALMLVGMAPIFALEEESFLRQNEMQEPQADVELQGFSIVERSEEPDAPEPSAEMHDCCFFPYSTLFVGGSYARMSLKPTRQPHFSGNLWGVVAGYQYREQDGLYAAVQGLWRQGNTTGDLGKNYLYECRAEERIGYDFGVGPSSEGSIALYFGLGYRFMEQALKQRGLPDVQFAYNDFYVPIGTCIDYAIPFEYYCLSLGLCATWRPQIYPTVNILPLGGARWIVTYELFNGSLELPITLSYCDSFLITLRPVIDYWKDGATVAVGALCNALGIPASSYLSGGASLEVGYKF